MRRERSIFEAFLTKIKPTIFCLVSKALPPPLPSPAFPTGQCGEQLYQRDDLADSRSFPIQKPPIQLQTQRKRFKRYF